MNIYIDFTIKHQMAAPHLWWLWLETPPMTNVVGWKPLHEVCALIGWARNFPIGWSIFRLGMPPCHWTEGQEAKVRTSRAAIAVSRLLRQLGAGTQPTDGSDGLCLFLFNNRGQHQAGTQPTDDSDGLCLFLFNNRGQHQGVLQSFPTNKNIHTLRI
jgi:hypothetical protein